MQHNADQKGVLVPRAAAGQPPTRATTRTGGPSPHVTPRTPAPTPKRKGLTPLSTNEASLTHRRLSTVLERPVQLGPHSPHSPNSCSSPHAPTAAPPPPPPRPPERKPGLLHVRATGDQHKAQEENRSSMAYDTILCLSVTNGVTNEDERQAGRQQTEAAIPRRYAKMPPSPDLLSHTFDFRNSRRAQTRQTDGTLPLALCSAPPPRPCAIRRHNRQCILTQPHLKSAAAPFLSGRAVARWRC